MARETMNAMRLKPGRRRLLYAVMTGLHRSTKRTKFGAEKQVYDAETMRALRTFFKRAIADRFPRARILYWT